MGNLHGAVEFVQVAQQAAIKPIFGVDLTMVGYPLLLYVEFPLPTASGKIILQTEGGECFFRNVEYQPITEIPPEIFKHGSVCNRR